MVFFVILGYQRASFKLLFYLGILLRNGYWYNIEENTWQQQRFPPYANVAPEPDAVWKFRGKPTIFGSTVCEGDGTCIYTGIEQYDLNTNTWKHLGRLTQTRVFHDVIEVPASFCDFDDNPLLPTSSAAMIVGGVEPDGASNPEIYSSVELFGCPGQDNTIPGPEFPFPIYFTGITFIFIISSLHFTLNMLGGIYYSEDGTVENGAVIVCGGFGCLPSEENCNVLDICYEYNPLTSDQWVETTSLTEGKWGHLLTTAPDVSSTSNREMPLTIGLTEETQIRDVDTGEWRDYIPLPEGSDLWLSFGCLVRYRYKVYHIREEVFELDTLYWEVSNHGPIPEFMANGGAGPGRCAITEIDNEVGELS